MSPIHAAIPPRRDQGLRAHMGKHRCRIPSPGLHPPPMALMSTYGEGHERKMAAPCGWNTVSSCISSVGTPEGTLGCLETLGVAIPRFVAVAGSGHGA